jgi:hypothetical protein
MAKSSKVLIASAAAVAVWQLRQPAFLPPASRMTVPAVGAAALVGASPAFADEIGDAAKQLAAASYDFAKEVDWNNGLYLQAPGKFQPFNALKAIDKMIVMGAQADPNLLKAAADAHHKAIGTVDKNTGVTSKADWEAVNAALGRVFASVPESTVMDVYNAVSDITDPGVPEYLKSLVKQADAEKAYSAFLTFKDVVKKNQPSSAAPLPSAASSGDKIGEAAKKLSDASYPFLQSVDWDSDLYLKPFPGASSAGVLKAIDKAIVMGSAMDGNLLKAAAVAHHNAIASIDAKTGVTGPADYEAVNAALGRAIASVPSSKVMDVYNAFAGLVGGAIPNKLFTTVSAVDATVAAKAFYEFKDVVKAAQR